MTIAPEAVPRSLIFLDISHQSQQQGGAQKPMMHVKKEKYFESGFNVSGYNLNVPDGIADDHYGSSSPHNGKGGKRESYSGAYTPFRLDPSDHLEGVGLQDTFGSTTGQRAVSADMMVYSKEESVSKVDADALITVSARDPSVLLGWQVSESWDGSEEERVGVREVYV